MSQREILAILEEYPKGLTVPEMSSLIAPNGNSINRSLRKLRTMNIIGSYQVKGKMGQKLPRYMIKR